MATHGFTFEVKRAVKRVSLFLPIPFLSVWTEFCSAC